MNALTRTATGPAALNAARSLPNSIFTSLFMTTSHSSYSTKTEDSNAPTNVDSLSHSEPPLTAGTPDIQDGTFGNNAPKRRLVVFGGSGFVGSRVLEQALAQHLDVSEVVSISRHGRPKTSLGPWADRVKWVQGDALDPQQPWKEYLQGAKGVVSTLGAFGSNDFMYKICGTANMILMQAAKQAEVPRFAFISVHDYKFPAGWQTQQFLLRGYFQGKRDAEQKLWELYPQGGVAIRPSFIYGSRKAGNMTIPLGLIGAPLSAALKLLPTRSLANVPILGAAFTPPVSVNAVGRAAATAALDDSVTEGIMDVWEINSRYG